LQLAGKDATEQYDPVHPTGTLESALPKTANLGPVDPKTVTEKAPTIIKESDIEDQPLDSLLNLDDFEKVAQSKLSEKAWAYYSSAADDLFSKNLNSSAYRQILFRPRVFIDVEKADTSTSILGFNSSLPIYVSPAAMARLGHPTGENGIARACGKQGIIQIVSNNASQTVEEIVSKPISDDQNWGFQLYVQTVAKKSEDMLKRVEATGRYKFVVLTLDAPTPGKREADERAKNAASGQVTSAVGTGTAAAGGGGLGKALFAGTSPNLNWKETIPWLSRSTKLPIVLKGIQTWEDAKIAAETKQVKGIILSNHGGRALDGAPPAIYTLLEIRRNCPEVFDKIEVLIDGGVKRGSDVVKALCLGAKAVGIGRAALFGLSVGGIEGVERVMQSKSLSSH